MFRVFAFFRVWSLNQWSALFTLYSALWPEETPENTSGLFLLNDSFFFATLWFEASVLLGPNFSAFRTWACYWWVLHFQGGSFQHYEILGILPSKISLPISLHRYSLISSCVTQLSPFFSAANQESLAIIGLCPYSASYVCTFRNVGMWHYAYILLSCKW